MNIKELLFSENGMRVVNALFILSLLFYRSGFIIVAYAAWIVYLSFCIKHTESKGMKIGYAVLIALAAIIICINLVFYIFG